MRVTDPKAMRAMAHPLRLDLIELLGILGPSTAARCARQLDTSQASCSFHLRQLAKYGFVERAAASGDSRERPWQLTDLSQQWSTEEVNPAADELERVFIQREADRIMAWQHSPDRGSETWRRASFMGGATLPLTAEELESVRDQLASVIEPYIQRLANRTDWPADHRFVRILLAGTPVTHLNNGD